MPYSGPVNAFILAGGKSMRMGRDKATLPFGGQLLIARAIESLRALHLNPRICGSRSDLANFAPITPDHFPGCGPLAGIEAALSSTDAELNLFLPVDLPDLPLPFVEWMMARAENAGAVATIPSYGGRPQPLCAIYHRAMADTLREALESRNYKVMTAVTAAAASLTEPIDAFCMESVAAALPPGVWPADPPLRHWFRNLNTPADLEYAASTPGANGRNPIS
jgi:molybdopterin-guanine dinucleotide biosynthesis protein A